jgi:hypothetical protein
VPQYGTYYGTSTASTVGTGFTILVSLILVKYPARDRIGLVNAMIWPRILVFTSMMLRVLNPAAFGSYGALAGILYS